MYRDGQFGRRHQRRVFDLDLVVDLVSLFEPAQDRDRVVDRRLADEHGLKPPLERRIFLDVLAEFVEGGRADAAQLAARQGRLQQVGGVHRTFGLAGADDQVQLIDEEDDPAFRLGDVFENGLEPLFKFAAELGAGDQRAHVEGDQPAILQAFGHVARDDALGQPLDDGGLAHAGVADQDRVVLGAAAEDLHDAADLGIAADDRVHLAVSRQLDQVAAIALERLVLVFGALVGDALAAAHFLQRLQDVLLADPQRLEQGFRPALDLQESQQQVLDRDILVLHPLSLGLSGFENLAELGTDRRLPAGHLGKDVEPFLGGLQDLGGVDAELCQQRANDLLVGVREARPAGASARAAGARVRVPAIWACCTASWLLSVS